jgi:hypothetical protein
MKNIHAWGARAARISPSISTGLCALLLAGPMAAPAYADVTAKDVQVMARALGFTEKPPTGDVNIGIVFAPGNPQSAKEATDLQAMLAPASRPAA